jgi:hypothetical protein
MQRALTAFLSTLGFLVACTAAADPVAWRHEWPQTDFSRHSVPFAEIFSGGPPKDGIPAIDDPKFAPVGAVTDLSDREPVIGVVRDGVAKAYPLRILMWHEIVNDRIGDLPVAVTFCPLCNAAIVFDRRLDGHTLDFGTTGKLRKSDLVMYDRQTESWWQQFLGQAIVGEMTGKALKIVPSRLESWANFRERAPSGLVLVPADPTARAYGANPYRGYDSLAQPFLYDGALPEDIPPLARVLSLERRDRAWSLAYLRQAGEIRLEDGTVIRWTPGQASALDHAEIARGKEVGNITVRRPGSDGLRDIPYFVDFAFSFKAFHPEAPIRRE